MHSTQTGPGCARVLALFFALATPAAADPSWWSDPSFSIWTSTPQNVENGAPVNLGQLKNVADQARRYLDSRLGQADGAGAAVTALCQFTQEDNYAPATVGQLKNVAKVFYDRLGQIGYNWQTGTFGFPSTPYPWSGTINAENQAPCNLGQLKNLFTFEIPPAFLEIDGDLDGMPSWWETAWGYSPTIFDNPDVDSDLDQLTNLEEFVLSQQTGLAFNPNGSHSFGSAWTDYEQSLLSAGAPPAAVAAQRGSDQNVLRSAPLFGEERRGVRLWAAQHLIATGNQAPPWNPIVGNALQWLGGPGNEATFQDIPNDPDANFAARADFLPAWPESGLMSLGEGFSTTATAAGSTIPSMEYIGPVDPENLLYSYLDLSGRLNQLRVWLRLAEKVNFPVTRSFYVLKKTRYYNTSTEMVVLPHAPLDLLSSHTLTVPASVVPTPGPAVAGPIEIAPSAVAVNQAMVGHNSSAQPFRFVFYAYPQALIGESGGAPVATETASTVYLPVQLNEDKEQAGGVADSGQPPLPDSMPDIDRNRTSVAAIGYLPAEAWGYDRNFIRLIFDASGLPIAEIDLNTGILVNETTVEVNISAPSGTKVYLYDDDGRAIPPEELESTEQQPIAPIWSKLTSGKIYAEIGRLDTAASCPPGSPPMAPAGAATITVTATFLNPQSQITPGQHEGEINLAKSVVLLPVEIAPDVLNSNRDYDEGERDDPAIRIQVISDAQTNELKVKSADVNGVRTIGEVVTDDLHQGWFGVHPKHLGAEFWNGSTVTIRKVPRTNPDDNLKEEGNVKLYATTGQGTAMAATFIPHDDALAQLLGNPPTNLVGFVYGSTATIPSSATFWMEGAIPGKITLEWRYQKGSVDLKHQQMFQITTKASKAQWLEVTRQRMFLESTIRKSTSAQEPPGIDIGTLNIAAGFLANRYHAAGIYNGYGQSFFDGEDFLLWAGLAKRAGAPVYAGMSDAQTGTGLGVNQATEFQRILLAGMKDVYSDVAWQFVAYHVGGIAALEYSKNQGEISLLNFEGWQNLDKGRRTSDFALIAFGNEAIARQEQQVTLAKTFTDLKAARIFGASVPWLMSVGTTSPAPGGPSFTDVSPSGDITTFADRWAWLTANPTGLFYYWNTAGKPNRKLWVGQRFFDAADNYDFVPPLIR